MIVLGGVYNNVTATVGDSGVSRVCDTTYSPIRLLDTNSYSWKTQYTPNDIEYRVPRAVEDVIGGG